MGRICVGRLCYGPSLQWAEFAMGRDVQLPFSVFSRTAGLCLHRIFPRVSSDKQVVNQAGRWLIEKCVDNQLYILNGKSLGDLTGDFTCHTPCGSRTVDYFIASRSLSKFIYSMKVHYLNIYSDHCMLSTRIKIGSTLGNDEDSCSDDSFVNCFAPDMYIWSESSKTKFQEAFSSLDIQNRLNKLDSMIQSSENDVNNLVKAITDVITCAGDMSLLRKRIKRKKTKKLRINKKMV